MSKGCAKIPLSAQLLDLQSIYVETPDHDIHAVPAFHPPASVREGHPVRSDRLRGCWSGAAAPPTPLVGTTRLTPASGSMSCGCAFLSCRGSPFSASTTRVGSQCGYLSTFKNVAGANPFYLLFDTAGASIFENSCSSNFGFTTTFSMTIFSGGTGVSLRPSAFVLTGRTLVSETNGI